MSIINLPNGIGESLGDILATTSPLMMNGDVWYVDYTNGDDSSDGRDRLAPLQTISQAHTNASNGDTILLMDGHAETFTSAITISKDVNIIGAGSSGGYPTVKLTNNSAAANIFTITASGWVQIRNIWFEEQTQACSAAKIDINTANGSFLMSGCYFECGQYDDDFGLGILQSEMVTIKNTTFISTATTLATQPFAAIGATSSSTKAVLLMDGVTIDGGTNGWSNYHAVDLTYVVSYIAAENISLLRGSDVKINASTLGYFNASTNTGGCRIDWCGISEPV